MRRSTAIVLMVAAVVLMAAGYLFSDKRSTSAPQVFEDRVAGYEELGECSATTSFDDRSVMGLHSDGHAEVSGDAGTKVGRWSFSDGRYRVTVAGETTIYTRVEVDPVACILVKGDRTAADLTASWFARAAQTRALGPDD